MSEISEAEAKEFAGHDEPDQIDMTDEELCQAVAELWVKNGGDATGLHWHFYHLVKLVADEMQRQKTAEKMVNKQKAQNKRDYPDWVCYDCGHAAQPDKSKIFAASTWRSGRCDVCGTLVAVTEARNFGYPELKAQENSDEREHLPDYMEEYYHTEENSDE